MKDDKRMGIYIKETNEFFYLETGDNYMPNPIPRLINSLTAKDKILFSREDKEPYSAHRVISFKEAEALKCTFHAVYISDHVKKIVEARNKEKEEASSGAVWGAKNQDAKIPEKPSKKK